MNPKINILIIEDEHLAAKRLERILSEIDEHIEVVMKCESVASSVDYLSTRPNLDLILMDIRLGDGISLDILEQVEIDIPVLFTTAYDEYALKAFKLQSIDYLLKPIDKDELKSAIEKYRKVYSISKDSKPTTTAKSFKYKERYLVKSGTNLAVVKLEDISYFYTQDGYTHIMCSNGKKHLLDDTLDTVQQMIDPNHYFRINRGMIIHINSIDKMEAYFNSRYTVKLVPIFHEQVIVSRERVKDFKEWIDR